LVSFSRYYSFNACEQRRNGSPSPDVPHLWQDLLHVHLGLGFWRQTLSSASDLHNTGNALWVGNTIIQWMIPDNMTTHPLTPPPIHVPHSPT
jgi:hypothetical protein